MGKARAMRATWLLLLVCLLQPSARAAAEPVDPVRIVARALDRLGGEQRLRGGPFELRLDGTYDLGVAMQGRRAGEPEPTPIEERVVADLTRQASGYEYRGHNYFWSRQHLREIRLPGGRTGYIDMLSKSGGWPPFAGALDGHLRHARALPQVMLMDALDRSGTLELTGGQDGTDKVAYRTAAGDRIELSIDRETGELRSAASAVDLPLKGRTTISWHWSDYGQVSAMIVPGRLRTLLGGSELKSQRLRLVLDPDLDLLEPPSGVEMAAAPAVAELRPFTPFGKRPPLLEQLAPGVHVVRSLRPGFRAMFVEFADHVVAIDAPAGWVELGQIPPWDDSRGGGIDELGDKMLRAIAQATGGKPVRYVALTHHHSDHIGGIRPFLSAGATLVGAPPAIAEAERFAGVDVADVRVGDRWVHSDGSMEVHLVRLPDGNPKADGFLVAYLPRQKILYVTGFFYPVEQGTRQPQESIPLATWFVDWLDASGLEVDVLYNLHAGGRLEEWQWEELRALARKAGAAAGS